MKKTYLYIIILVLFSLNILMMFKNKTITTQATVYNEKVKQGKDYLMAFKEGVLKNDSLQILSNNRGLNGKLVVKSEDNAMITLEEIAKKTKVILSYPEFSCDPCYEESLRIFKSFIDKVGEENVAIISKYENIRDLYGFKRVNNLTCKVYNLQDESLGLISEEQRMPFIFILNESLKTDDLFLFKKNLPELTVVYLKHILKKYEL